MEHKNQNHATERPFQPNGGAPQEPEKFEERIPLTFRQAQTIASMNSAIEMVSMNLQFLTDKKAQIEQTRSIMIVTIMEHHKIDPQASYELTKEGDALVKIPPAPAA